MCVYARSRTYFDIEAAWQSTTPGGHALLSEDKKALQRHIMHSTHPKGEASDPMAYKPPHAEEYSSDQEYEEGHTTHSEEGDTFYPEKDGKIVVVQAESDSYTINDMCGIVANGPGWLEPGYTNHALFEGLPPNTRFFYTVCSGKVSAASLLAGTSNAWANACTAGMVL
jgi:hypothetical protein